MSKNVSLLLLVDNGNENGLSPFVFKHIEQEYFVLSDWLQRNLIR